MSSSPVGVSRWAYWAAVVGVLAVAVWPRATDLGGPCFDCDELYAVRAQGLSPKSVVMAMARDGLHTNHPPLGAVPFLVWESVFGTSEAGARALPLLAGVVGVAALLGFGAACGRRWAGVFAAAVLAINPLHITYSAEARPYALLVALLGVTQVLFVLAWRRGSRGWLLAYYLVAAWVAFTHYFAVPVLIGHAAFAGWHSLRGEARGTARRLLLAVGLAGLPYLAWLPVMRHQTKAAQDYLAPLSAGTVLDSLPKLLGVGAWEEEGKGWVGLALAGGVLLLAAAGVWAAWRVRPAAVAPSPRLLPAWVGIAVAVLGVVGGAGFAVAFPKVIEPQARETLAGYGYDAATIDAELALVRLTGLLLAGCVAAGGVVLAGWRRVLERTPPTAGPLPVGGFLLASLAVPLAVVAAGSLTGVPFHQTRNLLAFLPAVCAAVGFALDRLASRPAGAVAAALVVAGLTVCAAQYHAVGRLVGLNGPKLGIDTIDWREVDRELTAHPPGDRTLIVVNRPATDPALHYLPHRTPVRVNADATDLPPRAVVVHLTDNPPSLQLLAALRASGRLTRTAAGDGWELWQTD